MKHKKSWICADRDRRFQKLTHAAAQRGSDNMNNQDYQIIFPLKKNTSLKMISRKVCFILIDPTAQKVYGVNLMQNYNCISDLSIILNCNTLSNSAFFKALSTCTGAEYDLQN